MTHSYASTVAKAIADKKATDGQVRSQISFYGSSVSQLVQSSYSRYKARHKGNQVANSGNTKPPFGRSWFKSWQPAVPACVPSYSVQTSVDLKPFET